ncbi:oxygen-dependent protoporphyrinogen oxidase [Glaciihabitans tibetensis]|uniref:Oxygen-dependent protoporphyrinogen oxidase n=1 Tax=Glaciihabitans tibetensis TaxID=1266600 RepID=A0A2T0VCJ9_9MICO|nr:FAD-dependent oxidoreductase [Glaciihabitans tibetensis]PRY67903.1 oxygen-dependent protoporphyrinogen oxidase [Glaciihabitans tibetensis]
MSDFVVVGGGVGGLVVARRLALGGASVTLVEASDHLGGTVARHHLGGLDLDAGAESFAVRGGTVAALLTQIGLGADIVAPNPEGAWLQPSTGHAVPLPKLSLLGIPGDPRAPDVVAVIGEDGALLAEGDALLPADYASDATSLGDLVERRMGTAVLDNLVAPIVRGVHSIDPKELDIDRVAPGLREAMRRTGSLASAVLELRGSARAGSSVAGIRGGLFRLVDALVGELDRLAVDIRLNTRVIAVEAGAVSIVQGRIAGRVVVAAPGLLGTPIEDGHRAVLATLVLDAPELAAAPRGTGVLVAAGASGVTARAATHSTAKWPWLAEAAAGREVVRLSYGAELPNHAELARADAAALFGVPLDPHSVIDFDLVQWRRPTRQAHTPTGISLVGETASGTGLAAVIGQAEAEAHSLLRDFPQ